MQISISSLLSILLFISGAVIFIISFIDFNEFTANTTNGFTDRTKRLFILAVLLFRH